MSGPVNRHRWQHLLALVALALFFRIYSASRLECISRDGVHFVSFARELAGDSRAAIKGTSKQPGMSYLLLALHGLLGGNSDSQDPHRWILAGHLLAVLGGAGACLGIYFLTRALFDADIALLAGLMAACWPQGVELSADVLSDMPHLALYLAAMMLGFRSIATGSVLMAAGCGVLAGGAYWLRQEALGIVIATGLGMFWPGGDRTIGRRIGTVLIMLLCFVLSVAPHAVMAGKLMPNKDLREMFFGRPLAAADASSGLLLAEVIPAWKAPGRMVEHWVFSGRYSYAVLVLVSLFLRSAPRADRQYARVVIPAIVLQLIAVQLRVRSYGEISSRYILIPAALSIPWAAAGLHTLMVMIERRSARRAPAIIALVLLVIFVPMAYVAVRPVGTEGRAYRVAGTWLRNKTDAQETVAGHENLEQLMFYAGRILPRARWRELSATASAEETGAAIAAGQCRWFVDAVSSRKWHADQDARFFEQLAAALPPAMREVFRVEGGPRRVIVWERAVDPTTGPVPRP